MDRYGTAGVTATNASAGGSPYRLSAVEWLLRSIGAQGFTSRVRDFAIALDKHGAFSQLSPSDAVLVATALAIALTDCKDPGESLRHRMRALLCGEDGVDWNDAHAVYQTYAIAAQLAAAPMDQSRMTARDG